MRPVIFLARVYMPHSSDIVPPIFGRKCFVDDIHLPGRVLCVCVLILYSNKLNGIARPRSFGVFHTLALSRGAQSFLNSILQHCVDHLSIRICYIPILS